MLKALGFNCLKDPSLSSRWFFQTDSLNLHLYSTVLLAFLEEALAYRLAKETPVRAVQVEHISLTPRVESSAWCCFNSLKGPSPFKPLVSKYQLARPLRPGGRRVRAIHPDGRDVQPGALVIGRHYITERDSVPVQYNGIV